MNVPEVTVFSQREARMASESLLTEVRACKYCEKDLPLGPRPVFSVHPEARVLIIGQAPGTRVHKTGTAWNDPSGNRLRSWMGLDETAFYDQTKIAIMPMGFCYPGKGKSGDLPPRPECAPLWHDKLLDTMPGIELTLLIGLYAQKYYLAENSCKNLTETVRSWHKFMPRFLPLPHPSPRNGFWLRKNPWFEDEVVPHLQKRVHQFQTS